MFQMGEHATNRSQQMSDLMSPHLHIDERMVMLTDKGDGLHNPLRSLHM